MMTPTKLNFLAGLVAGCLLVSPAGAQNSENGETDAQKALRELCTRIQQHPEAATESQVIEAADKAVEAGRPYAVAGALRRYLTAHPKTSLALKKKAIDNAMLVGDFNTAMVRCKAYLKAAKPGGEASQVVATLYHLQIDLLGVPDDAYRSMNSETDALCRGVDARKFDAWHIAEAQRRGDYVNLARRLAEIYSAGLPPAQTQYLCARSLDFLMDGLSTPTKERLAAAADAQRIVASIRQDDHTKLKYGVYAANLAFAARTNGKEPQQLEKEFPRVVAAAEAYLSKFPTAETLHDIMFVFGGGREGRNHGQYFSETRQGPQKQAFFVSAFGKLSDQQRKAFLNGPSVSSFASTPQWMQLAAKYPKAFQGSSRLDEIPFDMRAPDAAAYKRLAAVFAGSQSEKAAAVRSLAASADFQACVDHLVRQESWNADGYNRVYVVLSQYMWPSYAAIARDENNKLPPDYLDRAGLKFGADYVVKTPLALDDWTVREYLLRLWHSVQGRESVEKLPQMLTCLNSLAWVPYDAAARKGAFEQVYTEFKRWTNETRRQYDQAAKQQATLEQSVRQSGQKIEGLKRQIAAAKDNENKVSKLKEQLATQEQGLKQQSDALTAVNETIALLEKQVAQISPLEAAFKNLMADKPADPRRAPNDVCRELARAVLAVRAKDNRTFIDAARKLYPLVKDYDTKKTLMGKTILRFLVSPSQEMDIIEFQLEVLADQLRGYTPVAKASDARVRMVADAVLSSRPGWAWGGIPAADKESALKLNAVFAAALSAQIGRGAVSSWLMEALRGTRRGSGWGDSAEDQKLNEELVEQMILKKTLLRSEWRAMGIFAATNYMAMIKSEFPGLREKYPPESYFDQMFLEEAAQKGFVDEGYFQQGGHDKDGKILALAAKLVAETASLPVDGRGPERPYNQTQFLMMQGRALGAEPAARNAMLTKVYSYYGKTRFDDFAMGLPYFDLAADIREPEARKQFFAALSGYLSRAAAAPTRMVFPNMSQLANISQAAELTDAELDVLLRIFSPRCIPANPAGSGSEQLVSKLVPGLIAKQRHNDLFAIAPYLWKIGVSNDNVQRMLVELITDFHHQKRFNLEAVYSGVGLDLFENQIRESNRNRLRIARAQALVKVGGMMPVDRSDPHYPILAAQSDFLSGNLERAWQNYLNGKALALEAVKQLEPAFSIWLIRRNTELDEFDTAEQLARAALQWTESQPDHFTAEARARLLLAYANIAFQRPEYPRARALYGRIAAAEEFVGTRAQVEAELQIAEVDRVTKHYGEAIDRLEKLLKRKDRFVQCETHYHLAKVLFDQEQYVEALAEVEKVFGFDPTHADARIFEGRINLQIKRLERASRIKVGFSTDQEYIVAGKPLRIGMRDQTLAIAGDTMAIEMRVWSDSGDEEFFSLVPFADSKTQFEGQINTALAPIEKGDHTLQVLGNDRVHYDFSEQFKKAHNIEADVDHSLAVISDADLYASSGKILTKAEMEEQALERMLRARLKMQAEGKKEISLGEYRPHDQIKPGNPVNVRVIDSDQSVTAEKDHVAVSLATTSGDQVLIELEESDTHSGVFEGAVPTASASATAFASDSEQGSQPVFAISAGDHPAWVAQPDNKRPKTFSIDLNASEKLQKMTIQAAVPGRKLKQFLLQTSIDGKEFETIGSWPLSEAVWDGAPRVVRMAQVDQGHVSVAELQQDLSIAPPGNKTITKLDTLGAKWQSGNAPEIAQFSAAFHLPTRQMATLQLKPNTEKGAAEYALLVDGQPAKVFEPQKAGEEETAAEPTHEFKGVLGQGVHRIDIYVRLTARTTTGFEMLHNIDEPPYLAPCPADMFDPEKHPLLAKQFVERAANITAAEDGGSFEVAFGPAVRARVIRLLLVDFETDAPAISKVHLTSRDGRQLLPSTVDLLALKTNNILEVVPGDKVSVVYKDPRCISKDKRVREAFLSATYANGKLDAALLTGYHEDAEGMRQPTYIGLRRFKPDDTICVVVNDADADTSEKLDTVTFTTRTGDGKPVELQALETAKHSGVFVGKVFVVEEEPQRKSEIRVAEGEDLVFAYIDQENTDPGIPWERTATIESVVYVEPEFRVFNTESTLLPEEEIAQQQAKKGSSEYVPATRTLAAVRPDEADDSQEPTAIIGVPVIAELVWPTIVQTTASTAEIFVQTSAGRKKYGKEPEGEFDINVPGTIRVVQHPGNSAGGAAPPGYRGFVVVGDPNAMDAMDDGRFMFSVPMRLAPAPERSFATEEAVENAAPEESGSLVVRGGDDIFIGFKYTNDQDETKWITQKLTLAGDAFFNVMDRQYRQQLEGVFVGDSAYFRVINPAKDLSDSRDKVTVEVEPASGKKRTLELTETFEHSGVFKGPTKFVYADDQSPADAFGTIGVTYGEQVTATYQADEDADALACSIEIFKGSDGEVQPFTRQFEDPLMAVRTRLTVAESYFELAKKHRRMGQDELTEKEIATGKRLLEEALRDYPDTEARAQVDYLLANLSLEFAAEADEEEVKKKHFVEALSRFAAIVSTYRDSSYAPKAQYKKALTLEKMGEIDRACEEYVKLSYRWPDNPLIAETIARLGQYFLGKGKSLAQQAGETEDPIEAEKMRLEASKNYVTAAKVFGRLPVRFPSHKLADKTTAVSAQCFLRAKEYDDAIRVFRMVIDNEKADNELRAESLYWAADCYMRKAAESGGGGAQKNLLGAYRLFKDLTWDYPESKWAKYARGRLAGDQLAVIDAAPEEQK